jgi:hypothetical protein
MEALQHQLFETSEVNSGTLSFSKQCAGLIFEKHYSWKQLASNGIFALRAFLVLFWALSASLN